jgi:hypothetical protein
MIRDEACFFLYLVNSPEALEAAFILARFHATDLDVDIV